MRRASDQGRMFVTAVIEQWMGMRANTRIESLSTGQCSLCRSRDGGSRQSLSSLQPEAHIPFHSKVPYFHSIFLLLPPPWAPMHWQSENVSRR